MAYLQFYSNVQDVLDDCGVKPVDLGFNDPSSPDPTSGQDKLEAKIQKYLIDAKAMVDSNRNKDFSKELEDDEIEQIPICIESAAKRIAINMVNTAKLNRQGPIINVNKYAVKVVTNNPLTPEIRQDLEECSPITENTTDDLPFRIFNIDSSLLEDDPDGSCQNNY